LQLVQNVRRQIQESCAVKQSLSEEFLRTLCTICEQTAEALKQGHCVYFCGNGGSAADAQHLAAEFVGRFRSERNPLPAQALTTNTSLLTAIANDYGYEHVFARQIKAFARRGDVLFAISTSGNSTNLLLAVQQAKELGVRTLGLTGRTGGKLKEYVDVLLNVPSDDTPRVQESHIMLGHICCDLIETLWSKK
jgi:D-sedoheptulose 7-phosphate isomerase